MSQQSLTKELISNNHQNYCSTKYIIRDKACFSLSSLKVWALKKSNKFCVLNSWKYLSWVEILPSTVFLARNLLQHKFSHRLSNKHFNLNPIEPTQSASLTKCKAVFVQPDIDKLLFLSKFFNVIHLSKQVVIYW